MSRPRLETMRTAIMNLYDGPGWKARCMSMPDNQVIAIYFKCLESGRFEKVKKKRETETYYQYTVFDYI